MSQASRLPEFKQRYWSSAESACDPAPSRPTQDPPERRPCAKTLPQLRGMISSGLITWCESRKSSKETERCTTSATSQPARTFSTRKRTRKGRGIGSAERERPPAAVRRVRSSRSGGQGSRSASRVVRCRSLAVCPSAAFTIPSPDPSRRGQRRPAQPLRGGLRPSTKPCPARPPGWCAANATP